MKYRYLSREQIEIIHRYVAIKYGFHPRILNPSNLELCVNRPNLTLYGSEIHKTVFEKAASIMHEINKLHPFVAGNKRTAYEVADVFMNLNGYKLKTEVQEAVKISFEVAKCSAGIAEIAEWMAMHSHRSYERLSE